MRNGTRLSVAASGAVCALLASTGCSNGDSSAIGRPVKACGVTVSDGADMASVGTLLTYSGSLGVSANAFFRVGPSCSVGGTVTVIPFGRNL